MFSDQKKNFLFNIIASPFFLALPIAMVIIFLLPEATSKYKVELSETERINKPICQESYYDLNSDSIDERIVVFHNSNKGEASVKVLTNEGFNYDQWNFHGHFQGNFEHYYCADLNRDIQ